MPRLSVLALLTACAVLLGFTEGARAQDRPPIGFPTDPKDRAYTCAGQVMLAAFEAKESSTAWTHSEEALLEAGRRWVEDYAGRSGQSVDAALSGDISKLTDSLTTLPKGLRTSTVNWCVRNPPA